MIVKKMENPVYHRRRRTSLPGRGVAEQPVNHEKSFDQYLLEAFQGEVVQKGNQFSNKVSSLTKENLLRLNRI